MTAIGFSGLLPFLESHKLQATNDLQQYFTNYTGRWFEYFSVRSDPLHLNANDIAACGALSVQLKGKVIDGLMSNADRIDALLADCPAPGIALWDVDPDSPEYQAISDLYKTIRKIDGMGKVRTSKLLACKRPHFVPIRDQVVEALLGGGKAWWQQWSDVAANTAVHELVDEVTPANVPPGTSILRRLDVILWMHGQSG